eukprot:jgi/Chlat1/3650/Chrsp238S03641
MSALLARLAACAPTTASSTESASCNVQRRHPLRHGEKQQQRRSRGDWLKSLPLSVCTRADATEATAARVRPQLSSLRPFESHSELIAQHAQTTNTTTTTDPGSRRRVLQPDVVPIKKIRVGVDVDEVLARFLHTLNTHCNHVNCLNHRLEEFKIYDFKTVWKCSQEEANHRVHEFFKSDDFATGIPPIPGARDALTRLTQHCDFVVVTSRQHVIRKPTLDWLQLHFPDIFQEVHFGNHYALSGIARSKSAICLELGVEVLIDDNPQYAVECAHAGLDVLLFDWNNSYAWSKTPDGPTHSQIQRVHDWEDVEASLVARVHSRQHVS